MGSGEGFSMRNFIVCTVHLIHRVIKSRRLRWSGHIPRMEEGRSAFKILTGTPIGKRPLRMPDVDGLIRLRKGIIGELF